MNIEKFSAEHVDKLALSKYGSLKFAKAISHWIFGKRTPIQNMSDWGSTVCFVAKENDEISGIIYGYTIPMHLMKIEIEKGRIADEALKPGKKNPINRLETGIYDLWVHPKFKNRGVEKAMINAFIKHSQQIGSQKISVTLAYRQKELVRTLSRYGFELQSTYRTMEKKL